MKELREVEAFIAVAEEQHFRRAADRLGMTPSRMSQTIQALERRIGTPLFVRTSRRVAMTPVGEDLLRAWRPALLALHNGFEAARATARDGRRAVLRVGFATTIPEEMARTLVSGFMAETGTACLRYAQPAVEIVNWLKRDRAGLFVTWFPCDPGALDLPRIRYGPALATAPRGVLMARTHELAGRSSLHVEELVDHSIVAPAYPEGLDPRYMDAWTPRSTPSGKVLPHAMRAGLSLEELLEPLRAGRLLHLTVMAVISSHHLPDFVAVPLEGLPDFRIHPIWSAANETSAIREFSDFAGRLGTDQAMVSPH